MAFLLSRATLHRNMSKFTFRVFKLEIISSEMRQKNSVVRYCTDKICLCAHLYIMGTNIYLRTIATRLLSCQHYLRTSVFNSVDHMGALLKKSGRISYFKLRNYERDRALSSSYTL